MFIPLLVAVELFSQGRAPIDTGRVGEDNSAAKCKVCHLAQYEEWRGSRHSQAWSNDFFQFDYRARKAQWCRNCHIPSLAQQGKSATAVALRDEGINCVTCHVRGTTFYAKSKRKDSPHDTQALPDFGNDRFCEGCHQFNFPILGDHGELVAYTDEPMQNTVEQFRAGPFSKSKTCRDCHANSPGGHSYAGAHDRSMLRQALRFEVCRKGKKLRTRLTNRGAGHNVPTGDVHRHILVRAWRSNAPEDYLEAFYGRRFEPLESGGKKTIWDSTLPPNTYRDWGFDPERLGGSSTEPINIEVRYLYGSREFYGPSFQEEPTMLVYRERREFSSLDLCP